MKPFALLASILALPALAAPTTAGSDGPDILV